MKRILITTAAVLALGSVGLYGFKDTLLRFKVGVGQLRETIDDNTSTEHLVALAKAQLAGAEERLFEAEAEARKQEAITAEIAQRVQSLADLGSVCRTRLARLQPALSGDSQFTYAGCHYNGAEIAKEARRLVEKIKGAETEMVAERAALKANQKAVAVTADRLQAAQKRVFEERTALRVLGVQIRAEEAIAAAGSAIPDAGQLFSSGYGESKAALEKRMHKLQRQNARLGVAAGEADTDAVIPWGTDIDEAADEDLTDAVRAALGQGASGDTASAAGADAERS